MQKNADWVKPSTDILRNAPPLSTKRKRSELAYVSIIRTRSQKVREYHTTKLEAIADFYNKNNEEPHLDSTNIVEAELATYIHNIRHSPLNIDLVTQVNNQLPWFHWSVRKEKKETTMGFLNTFTIILLIASLTALYIGAQINLSNSERLALWVNQLVEGSKIRILL